MDDTTGKNSRTVEWLSIADALTELSKSINDIVHYINTIKNCNICGCMVRESQQITHEAWHERMVNL